MLKHKQSHMDATEHFNCLWRT